MILLSGDSWGAMGFLSGSARARPETQKTPRCGTLCGRLRHKNLGTGYWVGADKDPVPREAYCSYKDRYAPAFCPHYGVNQACLRRLPTTLVNHS